MRKKGAALITGGAGFVGSHLARRLTRAHDAVSVLVRPSTSLDRLGDLLTKVRLVYCDLRKPEEVEHALRAVKPRVVYHLASSYFNPPDLSARDHYEINVLGTLNLLEAMRRYDRPHLVFSTSAAECGSGSAITEEAPFRPPGL